MFFPSVMLSTLFGNSYKHSIGKSPEDVCSPEPYDFNSVYICVHYIIMAVCVITFTYGVISWSLIRKFRNINNYVFLHATLSNVVRLTVIAATTLHTDYKEVMINYHCATYLFFYYITMVYKNCLVVICYMFYVDIVQVFRKDIKRRYLKVTIFAWLVPLLLMISCLAIFTITVLCITNPSIEFISVFLPLVIIITCDVLPTFINGVIFIKVAWTLLFSKSVNADSMSKEARRKENCQRLGLLTSIFVLSQVTVFSFTFWKLLELPFAVRVVTACLQTLLVALFLPFTKKNRALWQEYLDSRVPWTLS